MAIFPQLDEAIEEVLEDAGQSAQFNERLKKLIKNAFDANYDPGDVAALLDLLTVQGNGDAD